MEEIYLDNSATTRPYDDVIELMGRVHRDTFGNPSSPHGRGLEAERLLKEARRAVAAVLGGAADELYFTSGGTEANNLAVLGAAYRHRRRGSHLVTTSIEHPSVLNCYRRLEEEGFQVSYLPVDSDGYISLEELRNLMGKETILVSVIHVNNEIGTVQPVDQIGALIKERNPHTLYHVDGVQSFAKMPVNPRRWQADLFSCSAHKIHGPKGVGALWVKENSLLQPLMRGGEQEGGLRPGTENVAGIAGFGRAAGLTFERQERDAAHMHGLKQKLYWGLREAGLKVELNGPAPEHCAPHIINLSFPGIKAEILLHALENDLIYTSPGSACHSRRPEPSHVLKAIGLGEERLSGALRFSFAAFNTAEEIDRVIGRCLEAVRAFGAGSLSGPF
jgi:cysteine desulfurase